MSEQKGFYIYSPKVEVYILADNGDGTNSVYNISDDVSSVSLDLATNAPSTAIIELASRDDKYDGKFLPMDKVVIFARKENTYQMFSGYLTKTPVYTIGGITLDASCSLYKLQCLYWDEGLSESIHEYNYFMGTDNMTNLLDAIVNVLTNVAGWDESKIHIAPLPDEIVSYAAELKERLAPDERSVADYYALMGAAEFGAGGASGSSILSIGGSQLKAAFREGGGDPESKATDVWWNNWATAITDACEQSGSRKAMPGWALAAICEQESHWNPWAKGKNGTTDETKWDYGMCQINYIWKDNSAAQIKQADGTTVDYFSSPSVWGLGTNSIKVGARVFSIQMKKALKAYPELIENSLEHVVRAYAAYNGGAEDSYTNPTRTTARDNADKFRLVAQRYLTAASSDAPSDNTASTPTTATNGTQLAIRTTGDAPASGSYIGNPSENHLSKGYYGVKEKTGQAKHKGTAPFGLQPSFYSALVSAFTAMKAAGIPGEITTSGGSKVTSKGNMNCSDGFRSYAAQVVLKHDKGSLAATPGESIHGLGWALDMKLSTKQFNWLKANGLRYNLKNLPGENWHWQYVGVANPTGGTAAMTSALASQEQVEDASTVWWLQQSINTVDTFSYIYRGARALINDVAVWAKVKTLFSSTMRDFASAPDGSIVAWYPDRYGMMTDDINYVIPNTEITNVTIYQTEDSIATHTYLTGGYGGSDILTQIQSAVATIDNEVGVTPVSGDVLDGTGSTATEEPTGRTNDDVSELLEKVMVMPVDDGEARRLYSPNAIYKRYGARPMPLSPIAALNNNTAMPYMFAVKALIDAWTSRYAVSISTTFLPELRPGMRVYLSDEDITAYVESVSHSMDYTGGFTSQVRLSAPMSSTRVGFVKPKWARS